MLDFFRDMKHVLCYGDSNSWGFVPGTGERYDLDVRWPGVLQRILGPQYRVIEEALNGRTTVFDDVLLEGRNGKRYLPPCLESHRPLDLVILALGLNDLKRRFSASAQDIARGVGVLIKLVQASAAGKGGAAPAILAIAPPHLGKLTGYAESFDGATERSGRVAYFLRQITSEFGCAFLDIAEFAKVSDVDGLHFDAAAHAVIGETIAKKVAELV